MSFKMASQLKKRGLHVSIFHVLLLCFPDSIQGNIRYSIPEEMELGAFVGNVARDLGLEVKQLSERRFRVASEKQMEYLAVNLKTGTIFIKERIDREQLCGQIFNCMLMLEAVVENPLKVFHIEVDILDINDNAPIFKRTEINKEISEMTPIGTAFPLSGAKDGDIGSNSIRSYQLSPSEYFSLNLLSDGEQIGMPELLLQRSLDREQQTVHRLTLTAFDGGSPEKVGTAQVVVNVLDANDNAPICGQSIYQITIPENMPEDYLIVKVTANDLDEGINGEVTYSFSDHTSDEVRELFTLDAVSGEIKVKGVVDFEEASNYQILVQAADSGTQRNSVYCKVSLNITDVNDNWPEIVTTSAFNTIPENVAADTAVSVVRVTDRDYKNSPTVSCSIPRSIPFNLNSSFNNYYTLNTRGKIDREKVPEYNITITCTDNGSPPLTTRKIIRVQVADINDNVPRFTQSSYTVYVVENNVIGSSIGSVSASDPDSNQSAQLSYSILDSLINSWPSDTLVSISSTSGVLFARRSFDYEEVKTFSFHVQVKDAGAPPLSSNVAVKVVIIDQNDNAPVILSPLSTIDEPIPRSAESGYLVSKVTATDADSGQSAQLSYKLRQPTDESLFTVSSETGEIWTIRRFDHKDLLRQKIVILVKDNGTPPLSSTVTINVSVQGDLAESFSKAGLLGSTGPWKSDFKLYLIILFSTTSFVLLVAIVFLSFKVYRSGYYANRYCCFGGTSYLPRRNSPYGIQKASVSLQMPSKYMEARDVDSLPKEFIDEVTPFEAFSNLMPQKIHAGLAASTINMKKGTSAPADHRMTTYSSHGDKSEFYKIRDNRQWNLEQSSMERCPSGQSTLAKNEVERDQRRFLEIHSHAL